MTMDIERDRRARTKLSRARSLLFVAKPRQFTDFQFAKESAISARRTGTREISARAIEILSTISLSHKPALLLGAGKDRRGPLVRQLYADA
jgi:hypothetical protein